MGTCKMRGAGRGEVGKSIVRGKLLGRTPQFRRTNTHWSARFTHGAYRLYRSGHFNDRR